VSESLYYRLGRGSLTEIKKTLRTLLPNIGEIGVYLDNSAIHELEPAYRELLVLSNIRFLEAKDEMPGSIRLDFFRAYLKSKNKLIVSDAEVEQTAREEGTLL